MIKFADKDILLWDFDGVILDSMPIRNEGFEIVLENFPKDQVERLMNFHLKNGGLSRYVKFKYFFTEIRGEEISNAEIDEWAMKFSEIMRNRLTNPELLIQDTCHFIAENQNDYKMHIVSGSDQEELRFLCNELGLSKYFLSIHGSPTSKKELVSEIIHTYKYDRIKMLLIGDSINDYEAAIANGIEFCGYNNSKLQDLESMYQKSFSE